jgi:SAM-dependent methyltransferase
MPTSVSSSWKTASVYDLAADRYSDYADGLSTALFDFSGKYAYADRYVWSHLSRKLVELRLSGANRLRILDAGCGPGTWIRRIVIRARELGFTEIVARGFDLSEAQIQQARDRSCRLAAEPGVYLDFDVRDLATCLPESDASVDLSLCLYSVLSHIPIAMLPTVIQELARVTSGTFISTVRTVGSMPSGIVAPIEEVRHLQLDPGRDWCEMELLDGRKAEFNFHLFSSSELAGCFSEAFEIETLEGIDFFHNRFAGDGRWNPAGLDLPQAFLQKLCELEEMFSSNREYMDYANHLLLVGRPHGR